MSISLRICNCDSRYCILPAVFINVEKVKELEKQILSDQDITNDELPSYIDGMEKDKNARDFLADDFEYNNILAGKKNLSIEEMGAFLRGNIDTASTNS